MQRKTIVMMKRLRREEKEWVRRQYADNILYRAISAPSREVEKRLKVVRFSSEEVFWRCMALLDDLKDYEDMVEARLAIEGVYNRLYCDLRDTCNQGEVENELKLAAGEVVFCAIMALNHYCGTKYRAILLTLTKHLIYENLWEELDGLFHASFSFHGAKNITDYIEGYMNGDEYLSDTIAKGLKRVKVDDTAAVYEAEEEETENGRLDNRQLVILFTELLHVDLDPKNKIYSALAELISRVSGRSKASIRKHLNEDFNYENEKTKKDVELVASLIEPISPQMANQLRAAIK